MAQVESLKIQHRDNTKPNEFFWHLKDDNGEIVATGEIHPNKSNLQRAVNNVAKEFALLFLTAIANQSGGNGPTAGIIRSIKEGRYDTVEVPIVER
jgi:uncharacterized protein YegP (UPF0339 family)